MGGFKKFLLRGNVVDLAVAVVIGAAFTAIITAFTKNIITPLIGLIFGANNDLTSLSKTVHGQTFGYGAVLNAILSFIIVALIVYFLIVLPVQRLNDRFHPTPDEPVTTRPCPECLSDIPIEAHRCAFCTSEVAPAA